MLKWSDKNIVGWTISHAEDLEESGSNDNEKEDTKQPWSYLGGLFFFLIEW
jgi:hypothetical protein